MLPAVVSGVSGLGPLNVAAAVNDGAAPDPEQIMGREKRSKKVEMKTSGYAYFSD